MSCLSTLLVALSLLSCLGVASILTPPVLPLVVRNPYLSTWLPNARDDPWGHWPMFWTGQQLGFSVLVAVPQAAVVYPLLGRPHDSLDASSKDGYRVVFPTYRGSNYDASTTNLTYEIPPPANSNSSEAVEVVLSFLSPITPTSTLRQSLPASYLNVHVKGGFDVNIYVDVNGQWVSGSRSSDLIWEFHEGHRTPTGKAVKSWAIKRRQEELFTERWDRSEWGTLHFMGPLDVHHEAGTSARLRQHFARTGTLNNTMDHNFRSIMDEEPVFAFSKSFKLNATMAALATDNVLFTIAHIQDPVIQYAAARGLTMMRPLWASWFATTRDMLDFHYADFRTALSLASNYSTQLAKDAFESGAEDYVDIVALSARQAMGATSFSGTPENPLLFLKEISSDGNLQTIDVIFPAFPFFLYTNPRWLAYLLEPLIEHMLSGQYPNTYAMHDLGSSFPNATGHPDGRDEYMPVEECGNILIMGLALVNSLKYDTDMTSGSLWASQGSDQIDTDSSSSAFSLANLGSSDGVWGLDDRWGGSTKGTKQARKWIERSYSLWRQWTGYLVDYSLRPHNQLSTDDFAGWLALQTNLALKGIIGIKAMGSIAELGGKDEDSTYFNNIADEYITKWEEYGMSRDGTHAKLAYDWYGSWTTLYNMFADSLLCFHLNNTSPTISLQDSHQKPLNPGRDTKAKKGFVPQHIYKMQSKWYHNVRQKYGLPLDSRHLYTKTDWEFFAAAVTEKSVREEILESVAMWINETSTDRPLTDLHNTEGSGEFPGPNFFARPVVGGHFAFLALGRACGGRAMEGLNFLDDDTITVDDLRTQYLGSMTNSDARMQRHEDEDVEV